VTSGDWMLLESLAPILVTLFLLLFSSTSSYRLCKRTDDWQIGCVADPFTLRLGTMRFIIGHPLLCDYRSAFMKKKEMEEKKTLAGRGWYTVGKSINQNFCHGVRSPLPFMCVLITGEKSRKIWTQPFDHRSAYHFWALASRPLVANDNSLHWTCPKSIWRTIWNEMQQKQKHNNQANCCTQKNLTKKTGSQSK